MDWEFGGSKGETGIRKNENMLNVGFSLKVIVAGYPGAVSERNKLYRQAGTVNFMGDGYLLDYTMDIESGQSGGPLYYKKGICESGGQKGML